MIGEALLIHFALTVLLFVVVYAVSQVKDLFALVVLMSVFSGVVSVLFAVLGAVDVAFTEAVVGSGVATVFLVILMRQIDHSRVAKSRKPRRLYALVMMLALGLVLTYGIWALPDYASPQSPANQHLSPEYIADSYKKTHTPNLVTAVLGDIRGVDTLVEAAVVVTAAVGCALVMRRRAWGGAGKSESEEESA